MKQHFGGSGRVGHSLRHTKLPFLLQELAHEFWREERGTGVLSEENRIERKITNTRASGRKSNAKMGAEGTPSRYLPRLFACESTSEFFAPAAEVSTHREKFRTDCALCIPTAIVTVEAPNMDNTKTPEVLAVIPLPTVQERRRREIMLCRLLLVAVDRTLAGEGLGLETARDLGKELRHTYPELLDEYL